MTAIDEKYTAVGGPQGSLASQPTKEPVAARWILRTSEVAFGTSRAVRFFGSLSAMQWYSYCNAAGFQEGGYIDRHIGRRAADVDGV